MQPFGFERSEEDRLVQGIDADNRVRIFHIDNTKLVRQLLARSKQQAPLLDAALAQSFSTLCLLTGTLKDTQRLTFKIGSKELRSRIFVDADAEGNVRAYLSEEPAAVSEGSIRCIRASGIRQFTGITDLPYDRMDLNLEHYFRQSEQIDTCLRTRTDIRDGVCVSSEALFVQALPGAPASLMAQLRRSLRSEESWHDHEWVSGMRRLGERPVRLKCYCSREMLAGMAAWSGGRAGDSPSEAICRVCGRRYEV